MRMKDAAAVFSVLMGVSMIGMWIVFYVTDGIPELETKPIELGAHISAELITAALLIVGGITLKKGTAWGYQLYYLSMGMLLYTLIMSPGYFLEKGDMAFVFMFVAFLGAAILFVIGNRAKS